MRRRQHLLAFACLSLVTVALGSCASSRKSQGLTNVDDLLTRVEQVQIESVVAREKASAAFDAFGQIVAPEFEGDPMIVFNDLVEKINASKAQAARLQSCVDPMKQTADSVFFAWTNDLEKFGNTNLRQASQARLAETRARYSAVHDAAVAALVSINAFNADLSDQALFLEHDFNSTSVAVIATEVPALTNQARDLSKRLNDCVATSKAYITASALRGQLEAPGEQAPVAVAAQKPVAPPPARKLPNPMAEEGAKPDATAEELAPTTTAPAHRRPKTTPTSTPPAQVPAQPATPSTQAPAQPVSKPAPTQSPSGEPVGNGGGR